MSVLLGGEFGGGGGEDFGVGVDIGFGGSGGHEGHVVERSEEDAAVEGAKVEETLEFEIGSSSGFAAIARRLCSEGVFGAGTELDHVPGKTVGANFIDDAVVEAFGQRNHTFERG